MYCKSLSKIKFAQVYHMCENGVARTIKREYSVEVNLPPPKLPKNSLNRLSSVFIGQMRHNKKRLD